MEGDYSEEMFHTIMSNMGCPLDITSFLSISFLQQGEKNGPYFLRSSILLLMTSQDAKVRLSFWGATIFEVQLFKQIYAVCH